MTIDAMIFPRCPEVCQECRDGKHILHIISELGDLCATKVDKFTPAGKQHQQVRIEGWAEDELFLEDLLGMVWVEYGRSHPEKQVPAKVPPSER
jgi:hypothetical protein